MLGNPRPASALASSNLARSQDCGAPRAKALNLSAPEDVCDFWFGVAKGGRRSFVLGGGGNGNCCVAVVALELAALVNP